MKVKTKDYRRKLEHCWNKTRTVPMYLDLSNSLDNLR
jgi:hypothetical protein